MKDADIMEVFVSAIETKVFSEWRHDGFIGGFTSETANFEIDGKEYTLKLFPVSNGEHWSEKM